MEMRNARGENGGKHVAHLQIILGQERDRSGVFPGSAGTVRLPALSRYCVPAKNFGLATLLTPPRAGLLYPHDATVGPA